jgi:hypothetical protein
MIGFSVFLLIVLVIASVSWDYRASIKRFFIN